MLAFLVSLSKSCHFSTLKPLTCFSVIACAPFSQVLFTLWLRRDPYLSKRAVGELAGTTYTYQVQLAHKIN
jgi:hypothetical protein